MCVFLDVIVEARYILYHHFFHSHSTSDNSRVFSDTHTKLFVDFTFWARRDEGGERSSSSRYRGQALHSLESADR